MEWIRIAVYVVLALAILIVLIAMTKPNVFRVRRTLRIKAPAEKIFVLINDFHSWPLWSPYEKIDPTMTRQLSGAASGVGAVYTWDSKGKAGAGRMEIVESVHAEKIGIKLDFMKPFEAHNAATFTTTSQGGETEVSWEMAGPALFVSKMMQVVFNLDKMIGRDFEVGLQNLKAVCEK